MAKEGVSPKALGMAKQDYQEAKRQRERRAEREAVEASGEPRAVLAAQLGDLTTTFQANTEAMAAVSMGSPRGVPVPCACKYCISAGVTPASCKAERISFSCMRPLGAVRDALLPSCSTDEPLTTA